MQLRKSKSNTNAQIDFIKISNCLVSLLLIMHQLSTSEKGITVAIKKKHFVLVQRSRLRAQRRQMRRRQQSCVKTTICRTMCSGCLSARKCNLFEHWNSEYSSNFTNEQFSNTQHTKNVIVSFEADRNVGRCFLCCSGNWERCHYKINYTYLLKLQIDSHQITSFR